MYLIPLIGSIMHRKRARSPNMLVHERRAIQKLQNNKLGRLDSVERSTNSFIS